MKVLNFSKKGNAILGQVTRLVRDWYAIKVLIINAETRFRDFSLFWKGWNEKKKKNNIIGEYRKGVKSCNRVTESFCGVFVAGVFVGFLLREFLWGFCRWGFWQIFVADIVFIVYHFNNNM